MASPVRPPLPAASNPAPTRLRLRIGGLVQGVGFRPFAHRLAHELELSGFVRNASAGAWLEVEGPRLAVETFRRRLESERPPHCRFQHVEETWLDPTGHPGFRIEATDPDGDRTAWVLPDLATCDECRREILDPANRRHRHPFANCTHCGPRFSVVLALPYDRERTTLRRFPLCPACKREFEDPADRRFHAQPIACPDCGPQLALWDSRGEALAVRDAALRTAGDALRAGRIVALKGLGGFQLLVRADDEEAVRRLRQRKHREAKPLALLCPSLAAAADLADLDPAEARLLTSPAAPIVLVRRRGGRPGPGRIADSVAPGNPRLGLMLPYTPIHHLLAADLGLTLVATSGNVSDDPICIDQEEALAALGSVADLFLVHDRPIARPVDDSVARIVLGTEQVLRRARGYAPLPLPLPLPLPSLAAPAGTSPPVILALGGHLKNSVALARQGEVFPSQHVGDLETAAGVEAFTRAARDLPRLLDATPTLAAADLHPDYYPTQHAERLGLPVLGIQHHEAHAWACLADNDLSPPALALAWDGTGLGHDRTIWGGEFLELTRAGCRRRAWLRPFALPGGDAAARDARRSALGLLHEAGLRRHPRASAWLERHFAPGELRDLERLLARPALTPRTSSLGRLFDAVAALLDLRLESRFEGEAALEVEWAATETAAGRERNPAPPSAPSPWPIRETPDGLLVDWQPFLERLLDRPPIPTGGESASDLAGTRELALVFHDQLAASALEVARRVGLPRVLLTGGCFQNLLLTERLVATLRAGGFSVYWHQRLPPNDGGLAAGQAVAAHFRHLRIVASPPAPPDPAPPCASPSPAKSSPSPTTENSPAPAASASAASSAK